MATQLLRGFSFLSALMTFGIAEAAFIEGPVQWLGNGHYYGLVSAEDITWTEARDAAAAMSFQGFQGHLVTITSSAENNFLESQFSDQIGDPNAPGGLFASVPGVRAWIGSTDENSEGNYQWITGEAFSFSDWAGPEPNNLGNEDYIQLWRRDFGNGPEWSWNDSGNFSGPTDAYIVEFAIPEPSSLLLFGIGTLGIVRLRRHMKSLI